MMLLQSRSDSDHGKRRWFVRAAACVLSIWCTASAQAQNLPPELQQAWNATRLPSSSLALHVQEVGGPALMSINASEPRNPASVMKMVTTWSALSGLGPDYRWRTAFYARGGGRVDELGTLSGPLYLKAGGDPFMTVEELWGLLRQLRLRGIKNLGEVIVDRSIFGAVATDPGEFDGAADRPYNASPDAMMVGLGAVRLVFQPDQQARRWIPIVDPPVHGVRIEGEVKWSNVSCPGSPSVGTRVASTGKDIIVHVSGTAAGSCGEFSVYRLAQSQPDYFSALFQMLWRELGGTLAKGLRVGKVPSGVSLVVWHDSETLGDTIRQINKQSNNVMARTLLLTLGANKLGPGATPSTGARAALAVLRDQQVDTRGWVIDNGAGLSRDGRLTAAGLADMLDTAWRSPLMPEFVSSLAISGVDGTVKRRLRNGDAEGMAHLKTGTLRESRALAGYVLGASGKRYILVSIANGERSAAVRSFDDALVNWLAAR
ncbi:D-alanyl-D-alanine carboxypeptidase/D-alanyl-D-alanine endopeptidase [Pollutimonas harenae]|uniref:D-alanyl-D-alanine carboxypeptidase/D-alanyl-D-alanine-endopeptidase n=1 Tax=Pollutimonas harenae TaxID=657015 RepID=A0A853GV28_9BURK|nr:D-alanyl-D-alanine carboxypeptidase/D-alanyl-D-alanine-endopeptidase [Pollutimonas harenae]NYT87028.1 D-alanyl-D-alanine carboxypeptidase/D-alanyl-D-alanine-endopeptidase [Pollutimonas harenae]TEA69245.1 D-alanyl-D-alanine carboxypeptidase/D-alanyl-D-alanine-endopeptidase [Pollutimonas harenae]